MKWFIKYETTSLYFISREYSPALTCLCKTPQVERCNTGYFPTCCSHVLICLTEQRCHLLLSCSTDSVKKFLLWSCTLILMDLTRWTVESQQLTCYFRILWSERFRRLQNVCSSDIQVKLWQENDVRDVSVVVVNLLTVKSDINLNLK